MSEMGSDWVIQRCLINVRINPASGPQRLITACRMSVNRVVGGYEERIGHREAAGAGEFPLYIHCRHRVAGGKRDDPLPVNSGWFAIRSAPSLRALSRPALRRLPPN
jgi:hypothetical protein